MEFSKSFKIKRFQKHYKELFPAEINDKIKGLLSTMVSAKVSLPILVVSPLDAMKQSFAYLFAQRGFVDYKLMSAYTLLDIYLGNNEDTKSVLDISPDVLCLYLGYGEFENKRQVDIIIQVINNMVLQGKTVWVYCKCSQAMCDMKFPGLISYFNSMKYDVYTDGTRKPRLLSEEI